MGNISSLLLATTVPVTVFLLLKLIRKWRNRPNWPPGPPGWPILGNLPMLGPYPYKYFFGLWKDYGPVVHIKMGSRDTIIINGYEACREALISKGAHFAGRPDFESIKCLSTKGSFGVLTYDDCWKLHKRIAANAMRKYANQNHDQVDDIIREVAGAMVDKFLVSDQPVDPRNNITDAAANVMFKLIFSSEVDYTDNPDFMAIHQAAVHFRTFTAAGGNPADLIPFFSFLPYSEAMKKYAQTQEEGINVTKKFIDAHQDNFDDRNLRDIVDHLIFAAGETADEEKSGVGLTDASVCMTAENLVRAGMSRPTTAGVLQWCCMYMAEYQDVQRRAQDEIDAVIGRDGTPKASDAQKMPYIIACLHEVMRHVSPTPLGVPHFTTRDTSLQGYTIPKDTLVFANLWSITRDVSIWKNPDKFDPERFITSNKQFDSDKGAKIGSFGFGKRRCLGEYFARLDLFLFLVILLQKVNILPDKNNPLTFNSQYLMTLDPQEFFIVFEKRA